MNLPFLKTVQKWSVVIGAITLLGGCGRELLKTVNSSDGVPISYEVYGKGTTALVFIHGWSCDRSYWKEQLESFSSEFQVVTVDLAGHGESGLGRQAWTIESFGDDVAAVIEELDLKHVILIGHSMGGDVIVETARRLPGRVKGLVWVDTYTNLGTPRTAEQVQTFIAPFRADFKAKTQEFVKGMFPEGSDESLVERVAADMSSAPPVVALASMESAITYDRKVTAALQELNLPVVAINPDKSQTHTDTMTRYGVSVVLMPGVGHFLMMENPEGFNRLLFEAVNKLDGKADEVSSEPP